MLNSIQNDVFEALLKAAVIESSTDEIDNYPINDISKIQIPQSCDKKIKKRLIKFSRKQQMRKILVYGKKAVACIIIVMGVMFGVLLQNEDVRAACYDVIVNVYDQFIEFRFSADTNSNGMILGIPEYLPAGYEEVSDDSRSNYIYKRYSDGQKQIVIRANNNQPFTLQVDNENYDITDIEINGDDGKLFISRDGEVNRLLWNSNNGCVEITGFLTKEVLINIGKNLK